jgi:hypothetical protein
MAWMLTVIEWIGERHEDRAAGHFTHVEEITKGMITELSPESAFEQLYQAQLSYNQKFPGMELAFRVIGLSYVDVGRLLSDAWHNVGIEVIDEQFGKEYVR